MSRNLRFARNVLLDTFVVGSFVVGISWLPTLGVMLGLLRSWPQPSTKRRPHLALILLCGVLFFANFLYAWNRGKVFTRTLPEPWLLIVCAAAWGFAMIGETVCWWEDRPKDSRP